ncbi:MAG: hypothetical protein RL497_842, partial [Pseudomonadota bacterium]
PTGILKQEDGAGTPVRILVEFLCFVKKPSKNQNDAVIDSEENSASVATDALNAQLAPLFRLTAVAEGDAKRSHVVVQTTFRLEK